MSHFNFYLQKLVCKQTEIKETRFWKLDMVGLWTVQRQEFWVMKNINTVIKRWFQEAFSCLHEIRRRETIWNMHGRLCGFVGRTGYCESVVWVKFPLYIRLRAYNVFLNRRLTFPPPYQIPEQTCGLLHENTDSCVMNSKLPEKLMAFLLKLGIYSRHNFLKYLFLN